MKSSEITFVLLNPSEGDVMAVLIPAMLRRGKLLKGKFLDEKTFLDESGKVEIQVSDISPDGALEELDEYLAQLENVQVISVVVETANLAQATLNFVEKTYVEFKQATVANIETTATLVAGKSAVLHSFATAFKSGHMKSLEMKLLAGQSAKIIMQVALPNMAGDTLPPLS